MIPANVAIIIPRAGPVFDWSFKRGTMPPGMVLNRASVATDGRWTDAPGSSYNTFVNDQPRFAPGQGLILEQARGNYFRDSSVPITRSFNLPANPNSFVHWLVGTGSYAVAPGTAVGTGWGTFSAGSPLALTITTAGTVTYTMTGSVNRVQVELGVEPTTFIVTPPTTTATRAAEWAALPFPTRDECAIALTYIPMFPPTINAGFAAMGHLATPGTANYFGATMSFPILIGPTAVSQPEAVTVHAPIRVPEGMTSVFSVSGSGAIMSACADQGEFLSVAARAVRDKTHISLNSTNPTAVGFSTSRLIMQRVRVWNRALFPQEMRELQQ